MEVKILFFGSFREEAGHSEVMHDVEDTGAVVRKLCDKYPRWKESKFLIAVDEEIVEGNTALPDGCTVAVLPPYSGG